MNSQYDIQQNYIFNIQTIPPLYIKSHEVYTQDIQEKRKVNTRFSSNIKNKLHTENAEILPTIYLPTNIFI